MPFDIESFLRRVEPDVMDGFLGRHGNGHQVDRQDHPRKIAQDVLAALDSKDWAVAALENCDLIAGSGGRTLLRSAGDHETTLIQGVEDLNRNDETCAVWLATMNPDLFDLVVSAAHARKGLGTRSWDAFSIVSRDPAHSLVHDQNRMNVFQSAVQRVFDHNPRGVPPLRSIKVNHFEYSLEKKTSHSMRPLVQVNIYGETAPQSHEMLIGGNLIRRQLPGLYRAALVFDCGRQLLEVVTVGGRPVRDGLVEAFRRTLLPDNVQIDRLVRRHINFELFRSRPSFDILPDDPISAWDVDEIRLFPPGNEAGLVTFECKREGRLIRDVYRSASAWFGDGNPIGKIGWTIAGLRLRLTFKPERTGKSSRIVTVELRWPTGTSLREKTNNDHAVAEKLFTRWGVFA
jgi:hypothetical protein